MRSSGSHLPSACSARMMPQKGRWAFGVAGEMRFDLTTLQSTDSILPECSRAPIGDGKTGVCQPHIAAKGAVVRAHGQGTGWDRRIPRQQPVGGKAGLRNQADATSARIRGRFRSWYARFRIVNEATFLICFWFPGFFDSLTLADIRNLIVLTWLPDQQSGSVSAENAAKSLRYALEKLRNSSPRNHLSDSGIAGSAAVCLSSSNASTVLHSLTSRFRELNQGTSPRPRPLLLPASPIRPLLRMMQWT